MDWIISIQKMIDYIEDNITDSMDSELLAKQVYVSNYYLQRVFSILCGCTLSEYIRNRRLTLAGYELLTTNQTILDVALKYGYETHESFTRAFTRFHGVTPSLARKDETTLKSFDRLSIQSILKGRKDIMSEFSERGYVLKENGAVYYTLDMDKTMKWFREVLGWYGEVDERTEDGIGLYGCVSNLPREIEALKIAPFTGIHLFYGEPHQTMVAFMMVQGIDKLYEYVKSKEWEKISPIKQEPWGSKTCTITTVDGCVLRFFE